MVVMGEWEGVQTLNLVKAEAETIFNIAVLWVAIDSCKHEEEYLTLKRFQR